MAEVVVSDIELSSTLDYSKLQDALKSQIDRHQTANEVYDLLGRHALNKLFAENSPDAYSMLRGAHSNLDSKGVVVLHDTNVDTLEDEVAQLNSIAIAAIYGSPTRTDKKNRQIAWPIHYDPNTNLTRTFSQSLGEAAYHTDTQYFERPEKYFGLFCVESDVPGKGTNKLIDGEYVMAKFEQAYGADVRMQLERPYPFKAPSVFTEHASEDDIEIVRAPIYGDDGSIRYRKDTIHAALQTGQAVIDDDQLDALSKFDKILEEIEPIGYHLNSGDAVLVNNHRILHARTAFDNPDRLLYRVRMTN